MDFMKVFDRAIREIKREVHLKVFKVPEIEQKVLDATDDAPWGPHGTALAEIAQATKKYTDCQMIMNVLWTRMAETGKNWLFVYKALAVIEYLVANGSERAVDDIIEHTYQLSSLASFEHVEPSGKDLGLNVRKKAETIVALLNDRDKIQAVRNKAAANREKYIGLSSSGITYKSGASSFSSSNFRSSDQYGGFGNTGDSFISNGGYEDKDQYGEDILVFSLKREASSFRKKKKKKPSRYSRKKPDPSADDASKKSSKTIKTDKAASISSQNSPSSKYDGDFDDFDPRGTSSSKPSAGSIQVDLFGENFVDFLGASVSPSIDNSTSSVNNSTVVDLFADANFLPAMPEPQSRKSPVPQTGIDLFASQPTPVSAVDLFAAPDPVSQPENEASKSDTTSNTLDPLAAVPTNNFDESKPLEAFTFPTHHSPKNEAFEVKSGIWADSLSRGFIDLNITAPAKVNFADVGIVSELTNGSESTSAPTTTTDDFLSGLSSHHGSFQK